MIASVVSSGASTRLGTMATHGDAADERADDAIEGLGAHHAGKRVAGQIDRRHRPGRTLQVQAERDE